MFKSLRLPWKHHNKTKRAAAMTTTKTSMDQEELIIQESNLVPCHVCGRTFLPMPLAKHEKICEKNAAKKRKPFNSLRQRVAGTDLADFHQTTYLKKKFDEVPVVEVKGKQNKWKEKHLELVTAIREAKGVPSKVPMKPRSTASLTSLTQNHEKCQSCDRFFGPKAYDRHVEWCKERKLRIQENLTASAQLAKERLEARVNYRVPPLSKLKKITVREKYSNSQSPEPLPVKSVTNLSLSRGPSIRKPKSFTVNVNVNMEKTPVKQQASDSNIDAMKNNNVQQSAKISCKRNPMNLAKNKLNPIEINDRIRGLTVSAIGKDKMVTWKEIVRKKTTLLPNVGSLQTKSEEFLKKGKKLLPPEKILSSSDILLDRKRLLKMPKGFLNDNFEPIKADLSDDEFNATRELRVNSDSDFEEINKDSLRIQQEIDENISAANSIKIEEEIHKENEENANLKDTEISFEERDLEDQKCTTIINFRETNETCNRKNSKENIDKESINTNFQKIDKKETKFEEIGEKSRSTRNKNAEEIDKNLNNKSLDKELKFKENNTNEKLTEITIEQKDKQNSNDEQIEAKEIRKNLNKYLTEIEQFGTNFLEKSLNESNINLTRESNETISIEPKDSNSNNNKIIPIFFKNKFNNNDSRVDLRKSTPIHHYSEFALKSTTFKIDWDNGQNRKRLEILRIAAEEFIKEAKKGDENYCVPKKKIKICNKNSEDKLLINNNNNNMTPRTVNLLEKIVQGKKLLKNNNVLLAMTVPECEKLLELDKNSVEKFEKKLLRKNIELPLIIANNNCPKIKEKSPPMICLPQINPKTLQRREIIEQSYDPFEMAQRQFIELLDNEELENFPTRPQTSIPPPSTRLNKKITSKSADLLAKNRVSVIEPPMSFKDSDNDDFEFIENLIKNNDDNRKYSDDMTCSSIDPSLINENDNLSIPENFNYSPNQNDCYSEEFDSKIEPKVTKKRSMKRSISLNNNNNSKAKINNKNNVSSENNKRERKKGGLPVLKRSVTLCDPAPKPSFKTKQEVDDFFNIEAKEKTDFDPKTEEFDERSMTPFNPAPKSSFKTQEVDNFFNIEAKEKTTDFDVKTEEFDGEISQADFTAEELFSVDDELYEEYKKYEAIYLQDKEQQKVDKSKKTRNKNINLSYGLLTTNETPKKKEEEDENLKTTTNDSAYGSLRKHHRVRAPKMAPLESTSSSGSENGTMSGSLRMSKFCYECGTKFPVATAKFCVECGVKRLLL